MGCQLLASALKGFSTEFRVVAQVVSIKDALKAASIGHVQVAIINSVLGDGPHAGFSLLREMRTFQPGVRCVLLLEASDPEFIINAFRAGAKGVFSRNASLTSLRKCIQSVHAGEIWASSQELHFVLEALARAAPLQSTEPRRVDQLTAREKQVIALVAEGCTNREISARLKLSPHTVKNYLFRIFEKLGIESRVELVLYALSSQRLS